MKQLRLYTSWDRNLHDLSIATGCFFNSDGNAIVCRRAIFRLWDVPKSAKKLWLCVYKTPSPHRYEIIRSEETWVTITDFELWDDGDTTTTVLPELAFWMDLQNIPGGAIRYVELQYTT